MIDWKKKEWRWEITFVLMWCLALLPAISELSLVILCSAAFMWTLTWVHQRVHKKLPQWLKNILRLSLLVICILLVATQFKGSLRLNDAIHLFVFLPILKNMELGSSRDRRIQILIIILLWTAGLLLCEQLYWIAASILMCFILAYLLAEAQYQKVQWRYEHFIHVIFLMGLSVPMAMIFFVLFPRMQFFGRIHWPEAKSGISSQIRPGDIASMSLDDSVFANVLEEESKTTAKKGEQYWRYATLNLSTDGLHWTRSNPRPKKMPEESPVGSTIENYQVYYQQIGEGTLLQKEGTRRLLPLGRMNITAHRDNTFSSIYFQGKNPLYRAEWNNQAVVDEPDKNDLSLPIKFSASLRQLSLSLKNDNPLPAVLGQYFKENFSYTLTPGLYSTLEDFALNGRQGYCEHFAALATTLLRAGGIPARVVVGFLLNQSASELNYSILNSDAHAWVEYWDLEKKSWVRFDPTSYIAPERLLLSQQRWRQFSTSQTRDITPFLQKSIWGNAFSWARSIYLKTNLWMLTYDRDEQRKVWRFENKLATKLWIGLFILLNIVLVVGMYFWRRSVHKINPVTQLWQQMIIKYFGVIEQKPEVWINLSQKQWLNAHEFAELVKFYCHLRYGREPLSSQLQQLKSSIKAFTPILRPKAD